MKILIINGPNLNKLGSREQIYGNFTLEELIKHTEEQVGEQASLTWFQSNLEGEIVEQIQAAIDNFDALIINPAGYSHTSVAIYDALLLFEKPVVEVHLTNIYKREEFRHSMLTAKAATAIMGGTSIEGYRLAVDFILSEKGRDK